MPYQWEHITADDRVEIGGLLLAGVGQYGLVSQLARELGTSRQFLYQLRARARAARAQELAPRPVGRPRVEQDLRVDRGHVERSVLALSQVAHASVRGIQECLHEVLGVERSVGWIEGVRQDAAQRAQALHVEPPQPLAAVADEVFAADEPVLEVVEPQSGVVLALEPAPQRDETAWGCTFLDLAAHGGPVRSVVADGAEGLRAGALAAGLPEPRLDHWHTLRDLGRIARGLEAEAYRRMETAERTRRAAEAEAYRVAHGRRPRRGRPLHAANDPASVQATAQAAVAAITRADDAAWVLSVVRDVLRPVDPRSGQVRRAAAVAADLHTAAALLRESGGRATAAATLLDARAAGLSVYLRDLHDALAGPRAVLDAEDLGLVAWAWQHRQGLGLSDAAEAWPQRPAVARQGWAARDAAVRTTSMAENLNSALAPHRAAHRGLPAPVLAVLRVYHNHHVFARGRRAGHSPLDLLGCPSPSWLDALASAPPAPAAPREYAAELDQTVTPLAA